MQEASDHDGERAGGFVSGDQEEHETEAGAGGGERTGWPKLLRPLQVDGGWDSECGSDELLELKQDLGDYVIVHELLHLAVPNHGKLWKSLMRVHLGAYEEMEMRLKTKVGEKSQNNLGKDKL